MNEPFEYIAGNCEHDHAWARENKKRADRLLAAVQTLIDGPNMVRQGDWIELRAAAIDYEDHIG